MAIGDFLAQPAVRTIAISTAKNVLVLGALATAAYFSNNVFRFQANNALQSAIMDYTIIKNMVRCERQLKCIPPDL
jgi:hypothetical protein